LADTIYDAKFSAADDAGCSRGLLWFLNAATIWNADADAELSGAASVADSHAERLWRYTVSERWYGMEQGARDEYGSGAFW
jgi:hypothetical protein